LGGEAIPGVSSRLRLCLSLAGAAVLWCLTYVAAMVFAPAAVSLAALSVGLLAYRARKRALQSPPDRAGAAALGLAGVAFAVSMFMPLWSHSGFRYDEAGGRLLVPHSHGILDADHIH